MLDPFSYSDHLISIIKDGARIATLRELQIAKSADAARRPGGLTEHSEKVARSYSGNQRLDIIDGLSKRFPNSWERMSHVVQPINWIRFFAASDSGAYTQEPDRFLVDEDGNTVEDETKQELLENLTTSARLSVIMPEAERRAMIPLACIFLILWDKRSREDKGKPSIRLFWPHDVFAICHPEHPDDEEHLVAVGLKISSPREDGKGEWHWVWSRSIDKSEAGDIAYGRWHHSKISGDGESTAIEEYQGNRLPIGILQLGEPSGYPMADEDRDILACANALNQSIANLAHTADMQGHTQGFYRGTYIKGNIVTAPDVFVNVGGGTEDTLQTIDFNPKLDQMQSIIEEQLKRLGVSRRNSPDAYTAEGRETSGIARRIAKIPHDQRLQEARVVFRDFEEHFLLPTLIDVHDTFSPDTIGDMKARVVLKQPKEVEDPEARQRRLASDLDRRLISEAQYMVLSGYFDSIQVAIEAGYSDERQGRASMPAQSVFAAALERKRASQSPVVESDAAEKDATNKAPLDAAKAITINEVTLGIERLSRIGDVDGANLLRRKLAEIIGGQYSGDLTQDDLLNKQNESAIAQVGDL